MLRISVLNDAYYAVQVGRQAGTRVGKEAEKAWTTVSALNGKKRLVVDLFEVSFVDDPGRESCRDAPGWRHTVGLRADDFRRDRRDPAGRDNLASRTKKTERKLPNREAGDEVMKTNTANNMCDSDDFRSLFASPTNQLHWLCYTLTGNEELSAKVLKAALEQSLKGADDVLHVLCLARGAARARLRPLPAGAHEQAVGRDDEAAAGGSGMSSGEKYVAAAYLVVFAVVLVYLVIMSLKLQRLQRELAELAELARERREREHEPVSREAAEVG